MSNQFPGVLRRGDANTGVSLLQYYLDFLSVYYDGIPSIAVDGIFGEDTENAVYAAQSVFGLSVDGLVGEQTWETIVDAYLGIIETIPVRYTEGNTIPFQGTILREGDESEVVRVLQEYLNYIAACIPEVPSTSPTGYFWIADAGVCGSNPACLRTAGYGLCQRHHVAVYHRSVQRFVCREPPESGAVPRLHCRLIAPEGNICYDATSECIQCDPGNATLSARAFLYGSRHSAPARGRRKRQCHAGHRSPPFRRSTVCP